MTTELTTQQQELAQIQVLQSSLYPGASTESVRMVLAYCQAAQLDPMQKPVHIVPMWDSNSRSMRDVVMPGINMYRIQAMRSGQCAGISEPEFGPDKTQVVGHVEVTFPEWCRVTVKRRLPTGEIAEFTAVERWLENYAIKGGKEKDQSPNAMWCKRVYGQIAKCAQAQALRIAFPEFASPYTAEEMEGKELYESETHQAPVQPAAPPHYPAADFSKNMGAWAKAVSAGKLTLDGLLAKVQTKGELTADQLAALHNAISSLQQDVTDVQPRPVATYAQIADRMHKAQTIEALHEAADLIGVVADGQQREELTTLYMNRQEAMEGVEA